MAMPLVKNEQPKLCEAGDCLDTGMEEALVTTTYLL